MIERINLIEREPFKLTYRKVVQVVAAAVGVCALLFGTLMLRVHLQDKNLTKIQTAISQLEAQRQTLIKAAPAKVDTGPFSDVKNQLMATPPWSDFVLDISNRLPPGSYLTSLSASTPQKQAATADPKAAQKKDPKAADAKGGSIVLSGISKDADEMSDFASALKKSPYVGHVSLKSSEKVEKGFNFVIECQLTSDFDLRGALP